MLQGARKDLRTLDAQISPALTPFGFAGAQIQAEQDSGSAIYCAALDDIRAQKPGLPDGRGGPARFGECYDVTVYVAEGNLLHVDTDGGGLIEMLLAQGVPSHAQAVSKVYKSPVEEAAWPIAEALRALFSPRRAL